MLNMIEEFAVELKKFNPKLFVLGGLQMMDNFPFPEGLFQVFAKICCYSRELSEHYSKFSLNI